MWNNTFSTKSTNNNNRVISIFKNELVTMPYVISCWSCLLNVKVICWDNIKSQCLTTRLMNFKDHVVQIVLVMHSQPVVVWQPNSKRQSLHLSSLEHHSRPQDLLQFAFSLQKTLWVPGQGSYTVLLWRVQVLEWLEWACLLGILKDQRHLR